jgi:hypothetical protein
LVNGLSLQLPRFPADLGSILATRMLFFSPRFTTRSASLVYSPVLTTIAGSIWFSWPGGLSGPMRLRNHLGRHGQGWAFGSTEPFGSVFRCLEKFGSYKTLTDRSLGF